MAEIRCPMCGKLNPDELETCKYCEARLKPLFISPDDDELIFPGESSTSRGTGEPDDSLPDWLKDLRGDSGNEIEEQPSSEDEEPAEKMPEFFFDDSAQDDEELDFVFESPEEEQPAKPDQEEQPEEKVSTTDWLAGLAGQTDFGPDEEVPEWLSSIREQELDDKIGYPEEKESEPEEKTTDWLGGLRDEEPSEMEDEEIPEITPEEEAPDWLSALSEEQAEPEEGLKAEFQEDAAPLEGELPDWLSGLEGDQPLAEEPAESEETEWSFDAAGEPSLPDELFEADGELPDWLKDTEKPDAAPVVPAFAEEDLPDWLKGEEQPEEESVAVPEDEEELPIPGEIPDWLTGLQQAGEEEVPEEEPVAPAHELSAEEETPDWLSSLPGVGIPAEEPSFEDELAAFGEALDEETPVVESGEISPEPTEEVFDMGLPDWLVAMRDEGEEADLREEEKARDDLAPAELPSWVQAMRPVESVIEESLPEMVDEADQVSEKSGPLAGLRSLLPITPGLDAVRKPQTLSIKLQATDSQHRHAAMLESLVSAETKAQKVTKPLKSLSQILTRWGVSLLLLLVVLLPILAGTQAVPGANLRPPEMVASLDRISKIPPNAPVLLVFDYEPGLSGEMEAAAAPVVDHLIILGARLTLVSTSPTGPILGERFLSTTQSTHRFRSGEHYINLGYLAGGQAGVSGFAANPVRSIQRSLDGLPAWETPALSGVQNLSDFAIVVVVTDNADTGRTWIEQAGSSLGETPMLMVVSAQAEPMIRPYFDSQQIKGMVTGLAGGAAYEQQLTRPGLGRKYWDAYSFGFLVAELLIFVGALWSVYVFFRSRRVQGQEQA